jgi:cold shock CspA family protein
LFSDTNLLFNFRHLNQEREDARQTQDKKPQSEGGEKVDKESEGLSKYSTLDQSKENTGETSPINKSFDKGDSKLPQTLTSSTQNKTVNEFGNESGQIQPPQLKTQQPFFKPTGKLFNSGIQNTFPQYPNGINKRSLSTIVMPQLSQLNFHGALPVQSQQNMSSSNVLSFLQQHTQPQGMLMSQQPMYIQGPPFTGGQPLSQNQQKPVTGAYVNPSPIPQARTTGRLKFFDESKNYGFFVQDSDGSDLFVHFDDLSKANMTFETLRKVKNGYEMRFSFVPLAYYGKYSLSHKAVDVELISIEPILPQPQEAPGQEAYQQSHAPHDMPQALSEKTEQLEQPQPLAAGI